MCPCFKSHFSSIDIPQMAVSPTNVNSSLSTQPILLLTWPRSFSQLITMVGIKFWGKKIDSAELMSDENACACCSPYFLPSLKYRYCVCYSSVTQCHPWIDRFIKNSYYQICNFTHQFFQNFRTKSFQSPPSFGAWKSLSFSSTCGEADSVHMCPFPVATAFLAPYQLVTLNFCVHTLR